MVHTRIMHILQSERNYCSFMMRKTGKNKPLDCVLPYGDDALINTKTLQSKLFEWAELEICRGLEIKINRSHRYQRIEEQRRAIYIELKTQFNLKGNTMGENCWEEVRKLSEKCTASAKLFARAIADADEKAVELERRPPSITRETSLLRRQYQTQIRPHFLGGKVSL